MIYRFHLVVLLCCAAALAANAQNYFVAPAPAGNDGNPGTSWSSPFLTIQKGIDSATAGQTVVVSNGTYVLTSQLLLTNGITLQGFGGSAGTVIDANFSGRIMVISNSAAVLDGFTLKNGKITTSSFNGTGINMYNGTMQNCTISYCSNTAQNAKGIGVYMATGTINNCVIQNNDGFGSLTALGGGGVYMVSGSITNSIIQFNRAQNYGGGVHMEGGLVIGCLVSSNSAVCGTGGGLNPVGYGGGVYMTAGTVQNCTIVTNQTSCFNDSPSRGGGIYIEGTGTVVNCTVSGNKNLGINPLAKGGGIYMSGGLVSGTIVTNSTQSSAYHTIYGVGAYVTGGGVFTNCTVVDNHDTPGAGSCCFGGGVYVDYGTVVDCAISTNSGSASKWGGGTLTYGGGVYMTGTALVDRCVIKRNYQVRREAGAYGFGGGVASDGGIMRNCLVMGNTSIDDSGGLHITAGTNENCTIVRNNAGANYGGVYWTNSPSIVNDIVYNNIGGVENDILPVYLGLTNVTYSCAPSLNVGTGNVTSDPLFTDVGSGAGTGFVAGDYRPIVLSPCATNGLVSVWMSTALDLAQIARLRAGRVDMGCYAAIPVNPVNYYVAPSGNDGNAGTSWSAPFLTIQKGVDMSTAGQTVVVSNGTYVLASQLMIGKAITVQGFGGSAGTVIDANYSGRIMVISNSAAVLDGFTLKNGKIATASFNGTGINMSGGTVRNCIVSGCTNTASAGQGIGAYMTAGTLDSCVIEKNSGTGGSGGGVFMFGSGCLVTNCVISGNQIGSEWMTSKGAGVYLSAGRLLASAVTNNSLNQGRYIGGGGGVYVADAGTVSNCVISGNALTCVDATTRGGGLYVDWGTVADCVITNNSCDVNRSAGGGGGVFVSGSGTVMNCTIAGNSVPCVDPPVATGGGGVYVDGGWVVGCVVSNNSSSYFRTDPGTFGGGVRMTGTSLVERCVIIRNYLINKWHGARYGGGVACDGGVMRSCLIMGNTANSFGGGLHITGGTNENCTIVRNQCLADAWGVGQYGGVYWTNTPSIVNAIVYNNSGGVENDVLPVYLGLTNVTYSCALSLSVGPGNITANPLFIDSGSGSGTTFTAGNYRLKTNSPCYNAGLNRGWMSGGRDLDSRARLGFGTVDLGCYEYNAPYGWLTGQSNIVLQITGVQTDITYSVLCVDSNLSNAATVLCRASNTLSFTFVHTNALASVDRRFYRVAETVAGVVTTNDWIYTAFRKQLDPGSWNKYALGIDYGASNQLNSTLGSQLAQGLNSNNASASADLFYIMTSQGGWAMSYPNGSGVWCDYNSGIATNTQVPSWQSFWIKRRSGGSAIYPIYSGYCLTNSSPLTFRSNDWHMITWPLAWDRKESDGPQQGWGFAAAGAQKGTSWLNSDLLTVGDGAALRFYYLHSSGRWCSVGQTAPASNETVEKRFSGDRISRLINFCL